jgi:predicted TPR repeat methyltransferase
VEKQEEIDSDEGFRLNLHGRYSHTEAYLCNVLSRAGFLVQRLSAEMLRMESGVPVIGFVVSAQVQG